MDREEKTSLYQKALGAGDELLRSLRDSLEDEDLEQVERSIAERELALKAAMENLADRTGTPPTLEEFRLLAAQQRILQDQARRVLDRLQAESAGSQRARTSMQGVHRILNPGTRSRYVDEKR